MRANEMPPQMSWRYNAPGIPGMGELTHEDVVWARRRPPEQRTPCPIPGMEVYVRLAANGPLVVGTVLEVSVDENDPSTHQYVVPDPSRPPLTHPLTGRRLRELVDDPWWSLRIRLVDGHGAVAYVDTREARLPGSPGWLPMDGAA